jgi:dTDP-4-amino-4,6-dideoxygalactose transaminase
MVTTNDPDLADRVRLLRNHGYRPKYYNRVVGGNFRLDALQAAVLRVKLKYLDGWTAARRRNAETYHYLFAEAKLSVPKGSACDLRAARGLILPSVTPHGSHIYNQFVVRCGHRDALMAHLKARHIGTEIYYPVALHLQECFADLGYQVGDCPVSERAAAETLALPIYPELTEAMQAAVVGAIADFYDD